MSEVTNQAVIDAINTNPAAVREALELLKRSITDINLIDTIDDADSWIVRDASEGADRRATAAKLLQQIIRSESFKSLEHGLISNRPTPGDAGADAWYLSTDEPVLYRSTGSVWEHVLGDKMNSGDPNGSIAADNLFTPAWDTSTAVPTLYYATTADGTVSGTTWTRAQDLAERIGRPFPVQDDLSASVPSNDGDARFIKLTAGQDGAGQYNEGLLTGESVSGSAPLVVATAVIDDPDSPMNGQTVHLLNTERRYLMPGESPGTVANDQMQQITGFWESSAFGDGFADSGAMSIGGAVGKNAADPSTRDGTRVDFDSADSPNARTGDHTDVKHLEVTMYMRIR